MADALFITIMVALFGPLFTFILTSSHHTGKSQRAKWEMQDKHFDEVTKLRDEMRDERQQSQEASEVKRREAAAAERLRNIEHRLRSIEARLPPEPKPEP